MVYTSVCINNSTLSGIIYLAFNKHSGVFFNKISRLLCVNLYKNKVLHTLMLNGFENMQQKLSVLSASGQHNFAILFLHISVFYRVKCIGQFDS